MTAITGGVQTSKLPDKRSHYSLLFFLCSGFCQVALVLCGFALHPSRVLSVYSQFTAVDNSVDHRKWLLIFSHSSSVLTKTVIKY